MFYCNHRAKGKGLRASVINNDSNLITVEKFYSCMSAQWLFMHKFTRCYLSYYLHECGLIFIKSVLHIHSHVSCKGQSKRNLCSSGKKVMRFYIEPNTIWVLNLQFYPQLIADFVHSGIQLPSLSS